MYNAIHRKTVLLCALSILPLPLLAPAQDSDANQSAPPVAPSASWRIVCHGVKSVPMTADAEQSIPFQIVAELKCGEEVTLLSNTESYTTVVRSSEGATGFVATMYLKKAPSSSRRPSESAIVRNGVARWKDGAPGCDQFMGNEGSLIESITADGVTVQVSLRDTGWKFRANVAIMNGNSAAFDIEPSKFVLDGIGAHGKPLFYEDPAELAKNMTHQALWTEANAAPMNLQTRAASSSTSGAGTVILRYREPIVSNPPSPNYLVQHQYAEEDAIRKQGKQTLVNTAQQIQQLALKPGTVQPNEKVAGAVWFERDKNSQELLLRIPAGGTVFEFPLSFKPQK